MVFMSRTTTESDSDNEAMAAVIQMNTKSEGFSHTELI